MPRFPRAVAALVLAVLSPACAFASDAVTQAVIGTYSVLESYCDTVSVMEREAASEYRRCYTRDGRYKHSEEFAPPSSRRRLNWGDDARAFIWITTGRSRTTSHYNEKPARSWITGGQPEGLTARALQPFLRDVDTEDDVRKLLREMEIVEDGPDTILLQYQRKNPASGVLVNNRLWVRRSDSLVIRGEEQWDGWTAWSATLVDSRVNAPLTDADLSETAPFFTRFFHRYNLRTHPREYASGIAMAAFVLGFVVSIAWRRPRNWARMWRVYAKGTGAIVAGFAVLSAIFLLPGFRGGHPPAIFMVMIAAAFAALVALAIAALLLGMRLGDLAGGVQPISESS